MACSFGCGLYYIIERFQVRSAIRQIGLQNVAYDDHSSVRRSSVSLPFVFFREFLINIHHGSKYNLSDNHRAILRLVRFQIRTLPLSSVLLWRFALAGKSIHESHESGVCSCDSCDSWIVLVHPGRKHDPLEHPQAPSRIRLFRFIRPPARNHLHTSERQYLPISEDRQPACQQLIAKESHLPRSVSGNLLHHQVAGRCGP